MSWFGETFGDSLTNLKGQITKITKEVLADDETTANCNKDSDNSLIKELEALCESKDIEINSLRDELCQLQSQYKLLNNDSNVPGNSLTPDQSQVDRISRLETELVEVKNERDHLNSCLDELQAEHNSNLEQLVVVVDQHKQELAELKRKYDAKQKELDSLKSERKVDLDSVVNDEVIKERDEEIRVLKGQVDELLRERDRCVKEKERSEHDLSEQVRTCEELRRQLEKLSVEVVVREKQDIEERVNSLTLENGKLKMVLKERENENEEMKTRLSQLSKEKDELSRRSCEDEESKMRNDQIRNQLKSLLQAFDVELDEDSNETDFTRHLDSVLNKWNTHQKTKQDQDEQLKDMIRNLESDVRKLREENENLSREMTISTEKWSEMERKYQKEVASLNNVILELKAVQQEVCINESQTDDVKRLEQEKNQFMFMLQAKADEMLDISNAKKNLEQELWNVRSRLETTEESYRNAVKENQKLADETVAVRNRESELNEMKIRLEERLKCVESEKSGLSKQNDELECKLKQLEGHLSELRIGNEKSDSLQSELAEVRSLKVELENMCTKLQRENCQLLNDIEQLKAQVIIRESNLAESLKSNASFQDQMNNLQSQINELETVRKELKKWKDASVDLEIQRQDLVARKEELECECLSLRSQLELLDAKDAELSQLKQANTNLSESCNRLHHELESRLQTEQFRTSRETDLETRCQKQSEAILELQEENNELKSRIQKFQEQMKVQMVQQTQNQQTIKDDVQQHRRTRSAIDLESASQKTGLESSEEVLMLKQVIQQEQTKYRELQIQFQEVSEKEANARKEFERLKQHLIEIEDHYTEETVESKKIIEDLKLKLMAAEEQLKNSSTLYTSTKVRDNQHLESLQSQVRLVSAQRDDLQSKLSAAEDEVQKHKASLMSLQIVLEQFQQDKEYEMESLATKYEMQLQSREIRFKDLEQEMETLRKQLSEATNGLKAASRLGEQLERKTQQVSELEETLNGLKGKVKELEDSLTAANQTNNGKIDKSLIKNLVVGYVVTPKADRKAQVLRIMASVLDFDQEERNKLGVDNTNSGWLSSILHPKSGGPPSNQSLSEAFIKFLENESRPQPQLKLLPEQFDANKSRPSSSSPKPPSHFPELVLPTFSSNQENESSVILKNVLKES